MSYMSANEYYDLYPDYDEDDEYAYEEYYNEYDENEEDFIINFYPPYYVILLTKKTTLKITLSRSFLFSLSRYRATFTLTQHYLIIWDF